MYADSAGDTEPVCPYCWERLTVLPDPADGDEWVVDCEVCCRPIVVRAQADEDGAVHLDLRREND